MIKILVKVKPGAARNEIKVEPDGSLAVKITERPIDGRANDYLVKYLAKQLNTSPANVQLEKGATSKLKRVAVNITAEEWNRFVIANS